MITKELALQALDALEYNLGSLMAGITYDKTAQAIEALRSAIAQGASEPVFWCFKDSAGRYSDGSRTEHSRGMTPLYAAPQVADYVPLTDSAILDIAFGTEINGTEDVVTDFARAIECAVRGMK